MIDRVLPKQIISDLHSPKEQVIFGPRQIGKTTLLESVFAQYKGKKLWFSADDADVRELLPPASERLHRVAPIHINPATAQRSFQSALTNHPL